MKEKISVIVPVYNLEKEVSKCLASLALQDFDDFEVIVVDDGSTDKTPEIIDDLCRKFDCIKVFHIKNHGLSYARNFGLKKACGKYVAFVDGDDFVDLKYLSTLYYATKASGAEIVICGYSEISAKKIRDFVPGREIISGKDATIRLLTKQDNMEILAWNKLYLKTLFRGVKYPVGKNFEDNLTTYKLLKKAKKVAYVDSSIYNHFFRANSITAIEKNEIRLRAKTAAAKNALREFKKDTELTNAANFSLLLSYFQFIDFSIKKKVPKKYFEMYRKKIIKDKKAFLKNPFCDKKRHFYIILITIFSGRFYKLFRKLTK